VQSQKCGKSKLEKQYVDLLHEAGLIRTTNHYREKIDVRIWLEAQREFKRSQRSEKLETQTTRLIRQGASVDSNVYEFGRFTPITGMQRIRAGTDAPDRRNVKH
jgi:hypothetical protein